MNLYFTEETQIIDTLMEIFIYLLLMQKKLLCSLVKIKNNSNADLGMLRQVLLS